MIRFLQTDNRVTKALLVVIIGAASVSMCVYLIPGLMAGDTTSADTFAVVYPHWYSKFLSTGDTVSQVKVEQVARQQLQQRSPQYAENPMILNFFEAQVGQQLVQQPAARRTQRQAHGNFLRPAGASNKHQVRQVRAGD